MQRTLAAVALRYLNAAEADPDKKCERSTIQAAAGLRSAVAVFGSDFDTDDGTCIRDYIHVTDLVSAHVAALSASQPSKFAAYNLGTGMGSSISQVITPAHEITGKPISVVTAARRPCDPPALVADAARAGRTEVGSE